MHFPLGAPSNSPVEYRHLFDAYNEELLSIIREFADVISCGLFGHQHVDSLRVVFSESGDHPLVPLFYTPSISPLQLTALGSFNPRVRVFSYDHSSTSIDDYYQYYLNLSSTTPTTALWQLEYSIRSSYTQSQPPSASAIRDFLMNLRRNASLWCTYWSHELGGRPHLSGSCPSLNSSEHCRHLCTMWHLSYAALDSCIDSCPPVENSLVLTPKLTKKTAGDASSSWNTLPIIAFVIIAFLAILLSVVLLVNRELCRKKKKRRFTVAMTTSMTTTDEIDRQLVTYHHNNRRHANGDGNTEERIGGNRFLHDSKSTTEAAEEEEEDGDDPYDADEEGEEGSRIPARNATLSPSGGVFSGRFSGFSINLGGGLSHSSESPSNVESARPVSVYENDSYYSVHSSLQRLCQEHEEQNDDEEEENPHTHPQLQHTENDDETPVNSRENLHEIV